VLLNVARAALKSQIRQQFLPQEPEQSAHSLHSSSSISSSWLRFLLLWVGLVGRCDMSPVPREYQFEAAVETNWRNTWLKITSKTKTKYAMIHTWIYHILSWYESYISKVNANCWQCSIVRQRMSWLSGLDASEPFGVLALRSCALDHHFLPNNFQNGRQCLRIFECMRCFGHLHDLERDFFRIEPFWRWHIAEMVDSNEMPRAKSEVSRLLAFRRDGHGPWG